MLSISDYNHLKLLYDKFYKTNRHIKTLIEKGDWDSVDIAIQEKEGLLRQLIFFEKPRLEAIKANKELMKVRAQLAELEKENIVLVRTLRDDAIKEVSKVKKAKKILNTYEPTTVEFSSTLDIKEEF